MPIEPATPRSSLHRPTGLRAGVVIGAALALVGAVVGTASGAVTPFQQVVIVNAPESPIPVTGTVNVGNPPANQNVTVTNPEANPVQVRVTNLPVTQPVSGAVSVTNLPAAQVVSKVYSNQLTWDASDDREFDFGGTINVSTLIVDNRGGDDTMAILLDTVAGPSIFVHEGDGSYTQNFSMPVPATSVTITCFNLAFDCIAWVSVVGS